MPYYLTEKRKLALVYWGAGWTVKQIAKELRVNETCIRVRMRRAALVYGAPNRTSAVVRALRSGDITFEQIEAVRQEMTQTDWRDPQ